MYETVSGLFRKGPFSSREGFFYGDCDGLIKGDVMKKLLGIRPAHSRNSGSMPEYRGL